VAKPNPPLETQPGAAAHAMGRVLDEYLIAKKALRWMLEHKAYWDWRSGGLVQSVSLKTQPLTAEPPLEVLAFIHGLAREIDLEAEGTE